MTIRMIADILLFLGGLVAFTVLVVNFYQWVLSKELSQLESTRTLDEPEDTQKVFDSQDLWEDEE